VLGSARTGRPAVAVLVAVALVWSTAPLVADLLTRVRGGRGTLADLPDDGEVDVTTVVRPGDEPADVVRAAVLMAAAAGPVAVVTDRARDLPEGLDDRAKVHRGTTVEEAISAAAHEASTPAVLLVSARSVPHAPHCRRAATLLSDEVGWVTGRVHPFTDAGFAPDHRDGLATRLRERARLAGLELWEPDATLVRSDLLAGMAPPHGRPWGAWVRARRAAGLRGRVVEEVLALRSTPLDADAYWPDAIARQRGAAADLASAVRSGPTFTRTLAALLLARELYVVGLLCWSSLPLLMGASGELPISLPAGWTALAAVVLAVARWASLRLALGAPLHPAADALSALHHLPGSLAAMWGATTARIRPLRAAVPTRPLVWASLVLAVLAAAPLVDHEAGAPVSRIAVGTSLVTLGLLWAFTVRSLVQRSWQRRSHRIPLDLHAELAGSPVRVVDGSPSGAALRGPAAGVSVGDRTEVAVDLDDGTRLVTAATVAARRRHGDDEVVGLELDLDDRAAAGWLAQLLRSGTAPGVVPDAPVATVAGPTGLRQRLTSIADAVALGLVTSFSVAVVALLVLSMMGFQPLVVRSGSMVPTLHVGDVVISEQVRAAEVGPGDVVTQPEQPGGAEAVTHRVVSVEPAGDHLRIETRGDANDSSEVWSATPDTLVGRHRGTVPWVGRIATGVRHSEVQLALTGAGLAAVVAAIVLRGARGSGARRPGRRTGADGHGGAGHDVQGAARPR